MQKLISLFLFVSLPLVYGQEKSLPPPEEEFLEDIFSEPSASNPAPDSGSTADPYSLLKDTILKPSKPPPPLRLIDSPIHPTLPVSGGAKITVSTNRPFSVQLVRPKLQNFKGYPLIYGFETWYMYIVKTEQVRINSKVLQTNGLPVFMVIISQAEALEELPTVLESPALMVKGLVDYGDTIVKYFKREKKRLRQVLDSLMKQKAAEDEIALEEQERLLERVADSLDYAEAYYELYRHFKRAKAADKTLIEFFLSHPFNRSLTYSIYSAPYALPRYDPPQEKKEASARKHKRF